MNYGYQSQANKQMNYIIQERLNKRFQDNHDLLNTFGKQPIQAQTNDFHVSIEAQTRNNQSTSSKIDTKNIQIPDQGRYLYDQAPRTSADQTKPHIPIFNNEYGIERDIQISLPSNQSIIQPQTQIIQPQRSDFSQRSNNEQTIRQIRYQAETQPQQNIVQESQISYHTPLSSVIKVKTTESFDNDSIPTQENTKLNKHYIINSNMPTDCQVKNCVKISSENEQLKNDLNTKKDELLKIITKFDQIDKIKNYLEKMIHEMLELLDVSNSNELFTEIKRLQQIQKSIKPQENPVSLEKNAAEQKIDKLINENKNLIAKLQEQEAIKNSQIERLSAKGNMMQNNLNKLIEKLKNNDGKIVEKEICAEISEGFEENTHLKNEVEALKNKLVDQEQDFYIKENNLLEEISNLEDNIRKYQSDLNASSKHLEMAKLRSSLDHIPKDEKQKEKSILKNGENESDKKGSQGEFKEMIAILMKENEKTKIELVNLTNNLKKSMKKNKKLEIKFFESSLRVVFLSSELERIQSHAK